MSKERLAIQRKENAERLLSDPLYKEAIAVMKASMFGEFQDTKLEQDDIRHELWQRMQLLKQFEGFFESVIKEGVRAQQTLTLDQKST